MRFALKDDASYKIFLRLFSLKYIDITAISIVHIDIHDLPASKARLHQRWLT
jgi:hypothetical protein